MTKFDKELYKEVGKQLRTARNEKGWSLQYVSDQLDGKKTRQTIMRYENGVTRPDIDTIKALCRVLSLDPDEVTKKAKEAIITIEFVKKTDQEERLLAYFRALNDAQQNAVMTMLESMKGEEDVSNKE